MIYRTENPNLFIGVMPSFRQPLYMTLDAVRECGLECSINRMQPVSFMWDSKQECLKWDNLGRVTFYGGWSVYIDLFNFAMAHLYPKGAPARRARYAFKFANRMMFIPGRVRPSTDELRGMLDAMADRQQDTIYDEREWYQDWGTDMLAGLIEWPTVTMAI